MIGIMVSVVIPTLNAADQLADTLARLGPPVGQIIIADGGSRDETAAVAAANGAELVVAPRGRGAQLAAGARAARGDWLLFLHADTRLEAGWAAVAAAFMDDPANARRAAAFRFALDDSCPAARRLEAIVARRCRWLALPYGDQGLLISRAFYDALGGFRALPLFEDVDLVRRIGRRRLVMLRVPAVTSANRYRQAGYARRIARNGACLTLYILGLPPRWIARLYG
jgi:rSAM/selenodomain-associated transferase 2